LTCLFSIFPVRTYGAVEQQSQELRNYSTTPEQPPVVHKTINKTPIASSASSTSSIDSGSNTLQERLNSLLEPAIVGGRAHLNELTKRQSVEKTSRAPSPPVTFSKRAQVYENLGKLVSKKIGNNRMQPKCYIMNFDD
jgi:hypothetical protein